MRSVFLQFISTALIVAAAAIASIAADIGDYQKRIDSARAGIGVLQENVSRMEMGEEPNQPNAEVFAELRRLIPNSEKVDLPNGSLETNNQWLADGLKAAEAEPNLAKRTALLSELEQRLGAISSKLDELQIAANADRSKDEG